MSRVHDAMRNLEHRSVPEKSSTSVLSNLVGALLGELADEVPDDPSLAAVHSDLLATSRSYETDQKKDLTLRFYLAIRSLLREHALLKERLRKAEGMHERVDPRPLPPAAEHAPHLEPPPIP